MELKPMSEHPDAEMRFVCGAERSSPSGREFVFFANFAEEPAFEPYGHIYSYRPDRDEPWLFTDIESYIHTAVAGRLASTGSDFVFLMSTEGEFWALGEPGASFGNTIEGAGYAWDHSEYGDIYAMSYALDRFGGVVFATGDNGQVYQLHEKEADWEQIGANLLGRDDVAGQGVARASDGTLYLVARNKAATNVPGKLYDTVLYAWHREGAWREVLTQPNESIYAGPTALPDGRVAIGGRDGVVLAGTASDGFEQVTRPISAQDMVALQSFQGTLYASNSALLTLRGDQFVREQGGTPPLFDPEGREVGSNIVSTHLSIGGQALLSVGGFYGDIVRFDGTQWERIVFPGRTMR